MNAAELLSKVFKSVRDLYATIDQQYQEIERLRLEQEDFMRTVLKDANESVADALSVRKQKQRTKEQLEATCKEFNRRCPVGAKVTLIKEDNSLYVTTVRHPAFILGGHTAVAFFTGVTGAYCLSRAVIPAPKE